jgi:hypothetical protein
MFRPLAPRAIAPLLLVAALVLALGGDAEARRRHRRRHHRRAHAAAVYDDGVGTFGLGLIVAGPTGLSGKLYMADWLALDFAFGYYYGAYEDHGLGAHVDLLFHPLVLAYTEPFSVPLYFGVGGIVVNDKDACRRCDRDDDLEAGVRVPFGLALEFNGVPLDFFVEIALIVQLIDDDDHRLGVDAAAGLRFWF